MKAVISILIIAGVVFGAYKLWEYWDTIDQQRAAERESTGAAAAAGNSLPGLPYQLQPSLEAAQKDGARALRAWLDQYGRSVQDPRLAWIELDYVLLISKTDPLEAKKLFARVKKRITPDSPVYKRIKDLEKTYE